MTVTPLCEDNFNMRWMFAQPFAYYYSRVIISLSSEKLIQSAFSETKPVFRLIFPSFFVCMVRRTLVDIQILHKLTNAL